MGTSQKPADTARQFLRDAPYGIVPHANPQVQFLRGAPYRIVQIASREGNS